MFQELAGQTANSFINIPVAQRQLITWSACWHYMALGKMLSSLCRSGRRTKAAHSEKLDEGNMHETPILF